MTFDTSGLKKNTHSNGGSEYYTNNNGKIVAKKCTKCKAVKDLSEYAPRDSGIGGRRADCRRCHYLSNKESIAKRNAIYRRNKRENEIKRLKNVFINKHREVHNYLVNKDVELLETRRAFYYYNGEKLYARECSKCLKVKHCNSYSYSESGYGKTTTICKECINKQKREELKNKWFKELKEVNVFKKIKDVKGVELSFHGNTSLMFHDGERLIARNCTTCRRFYWYSRFYSNKCGTLGRDSSCIKCRNDKYLKYMQEPKNIIRRSIHGRKWVKENQERIRILRRKRYIRDRDTLLKENRLWQMRNKDKVNLNAQKRRARVRGLRHSLTHSEQKKILKFFKNSCCLSENKENLHLDHVIPVSTGHGGTIYGNIIPLQADLNISKKDQNIFDWFADNRDRFGLEQRKFDELIEYLADINDMTTKEYEEYVRWCHDNPRTIDEIKAEKESENDIA